MSGEPRTPCPSCGAPIDPVEVCYYCCAAVHPSRRVREATLMRWAAGVAVLGVVLLLEGLFAVTPVTPVSDIGPEGAFQHFRVRGEVSRAYLAEAPYPSSNLFTFYVSDESVKRWGGLKVKVDGPLFVELSDAGRVPKTGDIVDVEGTLYAGEGFRLLSLNSSSMLRILPTEGGD